MLILVLSLPDANFSVFRIECQFRFYQCRIPISGLSMLHANSESYQYCVPDYVLSYGMPDISVIRAACLIKVVKVLLVITQNRMERKHGALRPQKPLLLIRDGEVGGSGILYLRPTRYTVTTRMTALRWAVM